MMQDRLQMRTIPIMRRVFGNTGLGAVMYRLVRSLHDDLDGVTEGERIAAVDAYFEIFSKCLRGFVAVETSLRTREKIDRFISAHISDPMLGPAEIAAAVGISIRHLHRLFSVSGSTLGASIRSQRLNLCRIDLANPRLHERSITEIAFSRGFSDSSHFSHCFRQQFGISARGFRIRVATFKRQESGIVQERTLRKSNFYN
jgi:AraC-like DNA-binding protein